MNKTKHQQGNLVANMNHKRAGKHSSYTVLKNNTKQRKQKQNKMMLGLLHVSYVILSLFSLQGAIYGETFMTVICKCILNQNRINSKSSKSLLQMLLYPSFFSPDVTRSIFLLPGYDSISLSPPRI